MFPDFADERADFPFLIRIQAVGRFVEDEVFRMMHNRLGEADAAFEPFGKHFEFFVQDGAEAAFFDGVINGGMKFFAGKTVHFPAVAEECENVHAGMERGVFGQIAEFFLCFARMIGDGNSGDFDPPGAGRHDSEHGAVFRGERKPVQRLLRSVLSGEIFHFYHNGCYRFSVVLSTL